MHDSAAVLVVEDDVSTQGLLVAVVKRFGMSARTAGDGRQALAIIAVETPIAILLDLIMPEMDGFEVLRRLKGNWPQLLARTIVITAAAVRVNEHSDLDLVWRFLRKPLDIDQLGACLLDCVCASSKKAGRDDAYETPPRP